MHTKYKSKIDSMPCWGILQETTGCDVDSLKEALAIYASLIHEWNTFAGLTSPRAVETELEGHIADSLSLAPAIASRLEGDKVLLDVGSGGGFPAIPLKMALPALHVVLMERSERKVGFLLKAKSILGLTNITVIQGEFPKNAPPETPAFITARAVEKHRKVSDGIAERIRRGSLFLCQSDSLLNDLGAMFHVEHVSDEWAEHGLRRGSLHLVSAPKPAQAE